MAEARVTPIWKAQRLFIALFFLGFATFFFWDGKIGYPRSNERWLAYEQHRKEDRLSEWPAYAASRGWTEKPPEKFHKREDIVMQFVCGGLAAAVGALVLAYWSVQKNRTLKTDEAAVFTPARRRIPFEAIIGLGKKNWEGKGIATVRYEIEGRRGKFVLDDYKFERDATHQILAEIEEKLLSQQARPDER